MSDEHASNLDDPLAGSPWSEQATVAGFVRSAPNETLILLASRADSSARRRLLDIGCGAGRNAVPLSHLGWNVFGVDLSTAMLAAARARTAGARPAADDPPSSGGQRPADDEAPHPPHLHLTLAPMDALPFASGAFDFIVAHGIWNLARSGAEFRSAVAEAARLLRPGGGLFLFTFSRSTLAATARPVPGETFVFTQFSGAPQCFLTAEQIAGELGAVGLVADPALPLRELNRRRPGELAARQAPVIYEGLFRSAGGEAI